MNELKVIRLKGDDVEFKYTENGKTKTIKRKVKLANKESNGYSFKFNKQRYIFFKYFDSAWGDICYTTPVILHKDTFMPGWNCMRDSLNTLVKDYESYGAEDEKVSAAPDTSKFISIKRGDLVLDKDYRYSRSTWQSSIYFPYFLKIGSAIYHKLPYEFWTRLYNLFYRAMQNEFKIDDKVVELKVVNGTAFFGIGLGY